MQAQRRQVICRRDCGTRALGVWGLAALVLAVHAQSGLAQLAAVPADIAPAPFPDFLTPPDDLPFADWRRTDAWPTRLGPDAATHAQRGVLGAIEAVSGNLAKPRGRWAWREDDAEAAPARELLARAFPQVDRVVIDSAPVHGENVFIVDAPMKAGGQGAVRSAGYGASMTLRYASLLPAVSKQGLNAHAEQTGVRISTTWFSVFDPLPARDARGESAAALAPRGVALLMSGLLGTPEGTLSMLTSRLQRRGWVVLRMVAQPSRFLERVEFDLTQVAPGELPAKGALAAAVFDDRGAEVAYAAQAAFAYLVQARPELARLPRAAIGFSGGAMTLPTVLAREPEAYAVGVMIGGGADFWLMTQTSNYNSWIGAVSARWPVDVDDASRRSVDEAYLRASKLDAYHTGSVFAGVRAHFILGTEDQAVPGPLGELLVRRARAAVDASGADADRISVTRLPVGHEALFMMLPGQFDAIADVLDRAAASVTPASRASSDPGLSPQAERPEHPPK